MIPSSIDPRWYYACRYGVSPRRKLWPRLRAMLREWRQRSAARRELVELDPRILHEIGVDPHAVAHEARQPFWRPLRNWRD